ncbi:histidinol-phosphate transaminase [Telmatospirillum siberiense]|uniref:Histidinol-phosphate aminotransferase n=1 Tax=Telmatospirillum siberiense TaxID=382514 RepID=A0A2N3Q128_9PROT|nr:histidinol-phosphate transaminase [Telmatospirillum siberiense]PKU26353.1 histidinol-phosphate transaminase [Telmatospirillum siberiense]
MSRFWSPLVHTLKPYVAGEQPVLDDLVKLNTNENPYGPSDRVIAAIRAQATDGLRLYPDPTSSRLRATIAARNGVEANQVFVGNGSDEVLAHTFQALLKHDQVLLFPDITYSFYPVYCGLYGIEYREVPLTAEMRIDITDYRQPCGAIIFPNPNAPTGCPLTRQSIAELAHDHPDQVVVIDEAYVDFGAESAIPLVANFPNLLVIQTFSKSRSLAGLRVGFAIGQRPLIEALERVKDSFNSYPLDRLAQAGAIAAYEDDDWFEETRRRVIGSRDRLTLSLRNLGFEILPSAANFLFVRHPVHGGAVLAGGLRERSVIVRHFPKERIKDYLRISIGTDAQCDRLVDALRALLS